MNRRELFKGIAAALVVAAVPAPLLDLLQPIRYTNFAALTPASRKLWSQDLYRVIHEAA
jgi:hypothetical protein